MTVPVADAVNEVEAAPSSSDATAHEAPDEAGNDDDNDNDDDDDDGGDGGDEGDLPQDGEAKDDEDEDVEIDEEFLARLKAENTTDVDGEEQEGVER